MPSPQKLCNPRHTHANGDLTASICSLLSLQQLITSQERPHHCLTSHLPPSHSLLPPIPLRIASAPPCSSLCAPSHLASHVCASITSPHVIFNATECLASPLSSIHHPASTRLRLRFKCILSRESRCICTTPRRIRATSVSNVLHVPEGIHSALH